MWISHAGDCSHSFRLLLPLRSPLAPAVASHHPPTPAASLHLLPPLSTYNQAVLLSPLTLSACYSWFLHLTLFKGVRSTLRSSLLQWQPLPPCAVFVTIHRLSSPISKGLPASASLLDFCGSSCSPPEDLVSSLMGYSPLGLLLALRAISTVSS